MEESQFYTPPQRALPVCASECMDISLGVMSEAASRVIPLLCGAALP